MHLNNFQRVVKLTTNLVVNPDLLIPYIKHNFWGRGRLPMDLELPWWSYRAIEHVDTLIEGKRIFEYGTGGSTIRFAKKAKLIKAVEDDKKWMDLVKSKLNDQAIKNVEICYEPFDFINPSGFMESKYLKTVDNEEFDIIIIDGQDHTFNERIKCFQYVEPRMKTGQFIILDDFWRYEKLINANRAKSVKIFESVGPCRVGVTSTAVFCY